MKNTTITIIILIIWAMVSSLTAVFYNAYAKSAVDKFELLNGQNKWYEMVARDCGRDEKKDKEDDYCRGFGDGYDYAAGFYRIDCSTRELFPNEDNPNLY